MVPFNSLGDRACVRKLNVAALIVTLGIRLRYPLGCGIAVADVVEIIGVGIGGPAERVFLAHGESEIMGRVGGVNSRRRGPIRVRYWRERKYSASSRCERVLQDLPTDGLRFHCRGELDSTAAKR